jgi:hypothetical protein
VNVFSRVPFKKNLNEKKHATYKMDPMYFYYFSELFNFEPNNNHKKISNKPNNDCEFSFQ